MSKRKQMMYCKENFALEGRLTFPFLSKTAKEEPGKFSEDKYKCAIAIDQKKFLESPLAAKCLEMVKYWYESEDLNVVDGVAGITDLNEGLDPEDKYYEYNVDKFRINAKRNPMAMLKNKESKSPEEIEAHRASRRPTYICPEGNVVEDMAEVAHLEKYATTVKALVRPRCYGSFEDYTKYNKGIEKCGDDVNKIKKYVEKQNKPIFGVSLELYAVRFVKMREGADPSKDSILASLMEDVEVKAEDIVTGSDEGFVDEAVEL